MTTCACMMCVGVFSLSCLFSHPSEQEVGAPAVIPLVHRSQKHMRVYYCWMLRSGATSSMYCFLLRWMTQIIDQHTTKSLRANTTAAKVQDVICYISTSAVCKLKKKLFDLYTWKVSLQGQQPLIELQGNWNDADSQIVHIKTLVNYIVRLFELNIHQEHLNERGR